MRLLFKVIVLKCIYLNGEKDFVQYNEADR